MRKINVLLVGLLFFVMGQAKAQDKPLIRYDEEAFMKVANKVNQKDYNTLISFAEKAFKEYFKHKGIKVDFTEADYHAHDTCAASFQKILKDKNRLAVAKQTAEDNFKSEKNRADSLQRVIDGLNNKIGNNDGIFNEMKRKMDSVTSVVAQKDKSIGDLTAERDTLRQKNNNLTTANDTLNKRIASLTQDLEDLKKEIGLKSDTIRDLREERDTVRLQKNKLEIRNTTLSEENNRLKNAQKEFDKVFDDAETIINNIYNANKEKSCADMKAVELQEALDAYQGIKSLIQFHPLSPGIENEVNQITAWSNMKGALEEAVKYMEGKYNNNTRSVCISKLDNIKNLSGRQLDEKNLVLQALKDQAQVNAKFNELLDYLKNEFLVIGDKNDAQDALKLIDGQTIVNVDKSTKQIVVKPNATYHKKHAEALKEFREIIANAAANGPKQNLQIETNFQKVIENIRSKFQ